MKNRLLTVFERGHERMQEFESRLSGDSDKNLFYPIKRKQWKNFENAKLKVSVKVDGKMKDVTLQKDVLGLLAAKSDQEKGSVDFDEALEFPLSPVSPPLASSDRSMRKTNKAKLYDVLGSLSEHSVSVDNFSGTKYYLLDLSAALRLIVGLD